MKESMTQQLKKRLQKEGFRHVLDWRHKIIPYLFYMKSNGREVSYYFSTFGGGWVYKKICGYDGNGWYSTRGKSVRCSEVLSWSTLV